MSFYQHRPDFVETRGRSRTVSPPESVHGSLRSVSPELPTQRVRFDVSPPPYRRSQPFENRESTVSWPSACTRARTRTQSRSRPNSRPCANDGPLPHEFEAYQHGHNSHQQLVRFDPRVHSQQHNYHHEDMNFGPRVSLYDEDVEDVIRRGDDWDASLDDGRVEREFRNNDFGQLVPHGASGLTIANPGYPYPYVEEYSGYGRHRRSHSSRRVGQSSSNINVNVNNGNAVGPLVPTGGYGPIYNSQLPIIICTDCGKVHGGPMVLPGIGGWSGISWPGSFPILFFKHPKKKQKPAPKPQQIIVLGDVLKVPTEGKIRIKKPGSKESAACVIM